MNEAVHVIGASGRSGLAVCGALRAGGIAVVPVVRDAAKWRGSGTGVTYGQCLSMKNA